MMKLYKYVSNSWETEISVTELDVEEKPKTYITSIGNNRIRKDEVGVISGYFKDVVYLLDKDFDKVKDIFIQARKKEIHYKRERINDIESEISKIESKIEKLEELKESEVNQND